MAEPMQKLQAEALELDENDRAELARVLLLSLEAPPDEEVEQAWAVEAERRYRELASGAVEAIPSEEVLAAARARLR